MNALSEKIREYIRDSFLPEGDVELRDDDDLLQVLDSLQILRMVLDLESMHSIKVDNSELTPENLGTIERLSAFLDRKLRESNLQESSCPTAAD
jgi:acyl carrier protein